MQDILELHEFFVEGGNQNRSHVLLHISEPDVDEKNKGYFFAVCEINNGSLEQIEHLQQMIDDLESGYYETEDEKDSNAFELTLEFINRRGHHVLEYKNALTNCLVGVLRGHDIFFAYHGNPQVMLFYPGKENLEELDVLKDQTNEQPENQLFSAMLQGTINQGDYFYMATPHVTDYFESDRIKKIVSGRSISQTTSHVQKVLEDLKTEMSFGGIFFHFPKPAEVPKTGKLPKTLDQASSASSINELLNKEKNTATILSPSLFSNWKNNWTERRTNQEEKSKRRKNEKQLQDRQQALLESARETNHRVLETKESTLNIILIGIGRALVTGFLGLGRFLKNSGIFLGRSAIALILLITNKDNKRGEVIKTIKNSFYNKIEQLGELPLISKLIMLLVIILALIFAGSLTYLKIKQNTEAKQVAYNNQIQNITDKKNSADASLLYNDENKAFTLLQEAKQIISTLPQKSATEKQQVQKFNSEIDADLMKLRKIVTVKPTMIVDLQKMKTNPQADKLVALDNWLIAYGANDNSLYRVKNDGQQTELKDHTIIPHFYNASTPKEQDLTIFLSGDNTIAEFIKDTNIFKNADIVFPNNNTKIAALFVYSRKLYLVDEFNNQIYKHSMTATGFDKGVAWLKDKTDLKGAVSMALDGDIFILKKDGTIIKLTSGTKQNFDIQGLDPKLDNPLQIWTYNGINNLYILEPTNKRLVVLDKNGKLLKQYTASEWKNPTGMVVDEAKKTAYVLDDNKIYKFSIN